MAGSSGLDIILIVLFFLILDVTLIVLIMLHKLCKIPYFKRFLVYLWIKRYILGYTEQIDRLYTNLKKRYE